MDFEDACVPKSQRKVSFMIAAVTSLGDGPDRRVNSVEEVSFIPSFLHHFQTLIQNLLAPVPTSKEHEEPKLLPESEGQDGRRVVAMVGDGKTMLQYVHILLFFESFALIL